MDVIACYCSGCKSELGRFRNSWNGIGNTYFSPVYAPLSTKGFEVTGEVHQAAANSQIENSFLQDLACQKCRVILGLRCDSAPEGHLLVQNQLILRLSAMSLVSEGSGAKAKISILQTFSLTHSNAKKLAQARRVSTVQPNQRTSRPKFQPMGPRMSPAPRASPAPNSPAISKISSPAINKGPVAATSVTQPSTPQSTAQTPSTPDTDVVKFKEWAKEAIKDQQKDIDRMSGAVIRIEKDIDTFKAFMKDIRTELASDRELRDKGSQTTQIQLNNQFKDIQKLNAELASNGDIRDKAIKDTQAQLNSQLEVLLKANAANEFMDSRTEIANRRLDNVSADIRQVGAQADEVDGLKEELTRMKERLAVFEAMMQRHTPSNHGTPYNQANNSVLSRPRPAPQIPQRLFSQSPYVQQTVNAMHDDARSSLLSMKRPRQTMSQEDVYDVPSAETPLPNKRRRLSPPRGHFKTSAHKPNPQLPNPHRNPEPDPEPETETEPEIISLLSSEHTPSSPPHSPALPPFREDPFDSTYRPPITTKRNVKPRPKQNAPSNLAIEVPVPSKPMSRPRSVSAPQPPPAPRIRTLREPISKATNRWKSSIYNPKAEKPRDENGILLRRNGEVDGRSLRRRESMMGVGKENVGPAHDLRRVSSTITRSTVVPNEDSSRRRRSGRMDTRRVMDSVETDEDEENRVPAGSNKGRANGMSREETLVARERLVRATIERDL